MSIDQILAALRALTDPLALLFLAGSLGMLWALWYVLRHDIDLNDRDDDREDEPKGRRPEDPTDLTSREKSAR